jgi:hypothetical protein
VPGLRGEVARFSIPIAVDHPGLLTSHDVMLAQLNKKCQCAELPILLGIVRDGGGVGADILDTLGVLGQVREQIFELLG